MKPLIYTLHFQNCKKKRCDSVTVDTSTGILPPHSDSHSLVAGYRKGQYQDIIEALEVMKYISSSTPSTHIYLRMFQLERQVLPRRSETSPPVRFSVCVLLFVTCYRGSNNYILKNKCIKML